MSRKPVKPVWYPLDNAGVLYSAIQRERYSAIYRFSAVMTEPVDPAALQRAVDQTMPRFPGFAVRIRRGAFWCYFEPNPNPGPFVKQDMANPCQPVRFHEDNDWLIRIFYYERRISLEVFHAISDGAGTLVFLRTLLAVYLRQLGHSIPCGEGLLDVTQPPQKEELEDAYARYAGKRVLRDGLEKTAFPNTSAPEPFYTLNVTMGLVPVDLLREKAKSYQATITEYLTAVLLQSLLENQAAQRFRHPKPVALAIPINLRPWFPTKSLRNFILTMRPCIDPTLGEYTLPEIIRQVQSYMHLHANRQEMQAKLTGNVHFTRNRLLQVIPLAIKNPVMAFSYKLVGVRPYSGTYTNPGAFPVPPEMAPHIQRMEVMLGQATRPSPHCASISYGNTMAITFAGTGVSSETERRFFTHLVKQGLPVKVESNRTR
ncbi:MAG: hypothetical protein MR286_09390 [Clostridiales bacterium]|nr:hypothetical protein [Clostridiales bacterium]